MDDLDFRDENGDQKTNQNTDLIPYLPMDLCWLTASFEAICVSWWCSAPLLTC